MGWGLASNSSRYVAVATRRAPGGLRVVRRVGISALLRPSTTSYPAAPAGPNSGHPAGPIAWHPAAPIAWHPALAGCGPISWHPAPSRGIRLQPDAGRTPPRPTRPALPGRPDRRDPEPVR